MRLRARASAAETVVGRAVLAAALAAMAAAAPRSGASPSSPSRKSSSAEAASTKPEAHDGVFGVVTLSGPVPKLAPRPVIADVAVCGRADRPSPALVLGRGKEVGNVFVWLEGAKGGELPKGPFRLDQKGCAFEPYAQVVSKGAPVTILNSDPVLHNVHATTAGGDALFNRAIPVRGQSFTERFTTPGVVRIKCDVHAWMNAWVFVADSPFAAVTDREGRFAFRGVAPGTYRLHAWHELLGEKVQPVVVPASGVARADVTLSLD
ncbi:MAG TPA: carboxypeptidase regulatory-like domain-containing protein [Thermoanaerobaculia bacterium]|nr:carboxypeptidase regulatory-like domain-containing protein [Thermoanaerobaculia bacterium]